MKKNEKNEKKEKNEKNEKLRIEYRIITLGDSRVGKTSILKRYINDEFENETMSTIGLSVAFKEITLKNKSKITLKLIDTAGQERYKSVTKNYYKNADGVLLVFAHDDKDSFDHIKSWKSLFEENSDCEQVPIFLIGNKNDKPKFSEEDKFEDFAKEYNISKYISTSAKDNINIDKVFEEMAELVSSHNPKNSSRQSIKKLKPNK